MVPWLNSPFNTKLHATGFTADISKLMWNDCYKVSKIEGYPLAWDKINAEESQSAWNRHEYNSINELNDWSWCLKEQVISLWSSNDRYSNTRKKNPRNYRRF